MEIVNTGKDYGRIHEKVMLILERRPSVVNGMEKPVAKITVVTNKTNELWMTNLWRKQTKRETNVLAWRSVCDKPNVTEIDFYQQTVSKRDRHEKDKAWTMKKIRYKHHVRSLWKYNMKLVR